MSETRGEWVRMRDEFPTMGVVVLVTDGSWITMARTFLYAGYPIWEFEVEWAKAMRPRITHWMKMPQLPSKEEIEHERRNAVGEAGASGECPEVPHVSV